MGNDVASRTIKLSLLHKLQQTFQMNVDELIDIYINDAIKKIASANKGLKESNWPHLIAALQELRYRSIDVGAVQFSHFCLTLEIATQERRLERLDQLLVILENKFTELKEELISLKSSTLVRA